MALWGFLRAAFTLALAFVLAIFVILIGLWFKG